MDLQGYGANDEQIQQAQIRVVQTIEWIMGMRKGVKQEVDELTVAAWRGAASGKFKTAMDNWDAQAGKIEADLRRIADAMGANAQTYAQVRGEVEQAMNRVDMLINTGASGDRYAQ
ncbi:WXG100 family type VII secretion target [Nonomuraea sp. 3-1Str]|uniref:WXG100 family type VII secretion target n=1 Tax=unclassified Nonomuraea TaxID=2593643 RepID=UPI002858FC5F|nr:WXG100 family type VII secretion target [Nonomuraea sp. 3-1Str]MDR8408568.1 WXG100 family type VII secretion target [Nonomuraea sp. 3-1Str]